MSVARGTAGQVYTPGERPGEVAIIQKVETLEHVRSGPTAGSEAGADRVRPLTGRLADQILEHLAAAGSRGLTNGELSRLLNGRDVTVWPRVSSLKARGKLKDSGATRPSPDTGTAMTVWILTTPEEEAAILERRRLESAANVAETRSAEAQEAAVQIVEEWHLGALFRSPDHIERVIQAAITRRLARQARGNRKARERSEAQQIGGPR